MPFDHHYWLSGCAIAFSFAGKPLHWNDSLQFRQQSCTTVVQVFVPFMFDKRLFFTETSTANKGRNTANNTLKRNFPSLMFHQKNRCYYMQI